MSAASVHAGICSLCMLPAKIRGPRNHHFAVECSNCGRYDVTDGARTLLEHAPSKTLASLGYATWAGTSSGERITITVDNIAALVAPLALSRANTSSELFEELIHEAPIGVYVIDGNFRVRTVNQTARPIFASVPHLIGRNFGEVLHAIFSPLRAREFARLFRHTLETGEPYFAPDDGDVLHDDGESSYFAWQIKRVSLPEGGHGVVCYFRDISPQIASRQATEDAQRQLGFVMDSMPQKIWTATPGGTIEYLNSQWTEFTGLEPEQIRNWGRTGFIHPGDLSHTFAIWQRGFELGEPIQIEHRFQRRDGEYRWHMSRCVPMRNAEGAIEMWVGSSTDIHDKKVTENELQRSTVALAEADRRKDEFLATLAHELRNPLAPISNALHVLQLTDHDDKSSSLAKAIIARQTAHMTRLVDDLLDLSRIARGTINLRLEPIDLALVLQQALETSRPAILNARHEVVLTLPDTPIHLQADPVRLVQVFGNLLNNAAKYTNPGGCIWMTAQRDGDDVVVSVKDNGMGIPPHLLRSVFEMFSQVDHSLERSRGGLGIGLSLVQRLVALHDGSVSAQSEGLGRGSEFIVRLPARPIDAPTASVPHTQPAASASVRRRVLIVDDNHDAADSLALYLQLLGHETRTAYDGLEAVHLAAEFHAELMIIDLGMPKLNGYEAARRIRQQPWGESITLVALSGWAQTSDRRKSSEAGLNEHLVKPIDRVALARLLADLPASRPSG